MAQGLSLNELTGTTTVNQEDLLLIYQTGSTLNITFGSLTQNIINTNFTGETMTVTGLTTCASISATTYLNLPYGSGTTNYLPKWTGETGLGNSKILDSGSTIWVGYNNLLDSFIVSANTFGIGTDFPQVKLHVCSGTTGVNLSNTDIAVFENSGYTNVSILSSDQQNASLQFGSTSDVLGAYIRWNHDNNEMSIGTANNGDNIRFVTGDEITSMFLRNGYGLGIGTESPTERLHVSGNTLIDGNIIYPSPITPPINSSDNGVKGTITWDNNYFYICIDTNTWKRTQLSSW